MDYKRAPVLTFPERQDLITDSRTLELHQALTRQADRLLTLLIHKMMVYGNDRFRDHDLEFDAWVSFTDVYRKFIRCENMTRAIAHRGDKDEELMDTALDTYSDLANYAMISLYHMSKHHPDNTHIMKLYNHDK